VDASVRIRVTAIPRLNHVISHRQSQNRRSRLVVLAIVAAFVSGCSTHRDAETLQLSSGRRIRVVHRGMVESTLCTGGGAHGRPSAINRHRRRGAGRVCARLAVATAVILASGQLLVAAVRQEIATVLVIAPTNSAVIFIDAGAVSKGAANRRCPKSMVSARSRELASHP
jgi:hypothetical protein